MTRNKHQGDAYAEDEHGWYREPRSCVEQLFDAVDFRGGLIYDPCCGVGNILDVAKDRGFATIGSDIVQRGARHPFTRGNFLKLTRFPRPIDRPLNIVMNPPFNTPPGSALAIALKAIEFVPFWRFAMLVPLEFVCGQDRYEDLFSKHPPWGVAYCSQRPSMPPGTEVEALALLGKDFRGGKADFVWIIWERDYRGPTRSIWLRPDRVAAPLSDRRIRRGSRSPSVSAQGRK